MKLSKLIKLKRKLERAIIRELILKLKSMKNETNRAGHN